MLVKFGAIITDGVNSIGGHTISSNHYGRYQKSKPIPSLIQNDWTARTRSNFSTLSQAWRTLSIDAQSAWIGAAPNYPRTNSLGETYYPTGLNLFIWLNQNLTLAGEAMVTTPPSREFPPALPSFSIIEWSPADPKLLINFMEYPDTSNSKLVVFATRGLSSGITVVSDALRFIGYYSSPDAAVSLSDAYDNKFSFQPANSRVFVKAFLVELSSGLQGIPMFAMSDPL